MKLKPLLIGLVAAGVLGAAGYGLYATGMNRGMGMASAPALWKWSIFMTWSSVCRRKSGELARNAAISR